MKRTQIKFLALSCIMLSALVLHGQTEKEVKVGKVTPGEVDFSGFKLSQDATISIKGTGASYEKWGNNLMYYGWIIESESRDLVWSLLDEYENDYFKGGGLFDFEVEVKLEKGTYEVYYTGILDNPNFKTYGNDFSDVIQGVVRAIVTDDDHYYDRSEKNYMTVTSNNNGFTVNNGRDYIDNLFSKSIASFIRMGDNESVQKSFSLTNETQVYIYSLGERQSKEFYDFAWIYNLKTHEKIWPNEFTDIDRAGGGRKNFSVFQQLTLPVGEYQINYVTDGSHSFDEWNVMPPNDPQFWGVSIWCDRKDMKNISYEITEANPVVDLTRVRDNEFVSQGFELSNATEVRVICLGEAIGSEPSDYGWIIDTKTRKKVWEFSKTRSEYAGGSSKNRMINEVIRLEKGNYIAYYATDGSHSYNHWNATPPYDQKLWGLSIWTVNDDDKIKLVDADKLNDENVIVGIIGVRDNQRDYKEFSLEKETKLRVYAIGEGSNGSMADSGWIKNMDTGKIVWEMTYRTSEHAGGAHKNRMFNDYVLLAAGNYRLYYESDGSHSFMDWNDDPPNDPMNYGIKILKK